MSTNKTQNYGLHAWALADELPLGEVNENFAKLDAALKAGLTAAEGSVGQKAEIVVGSYIGDATKARSIALGFAPKAVLVIPANGQLCSTYGYYGGLAVTGKAVAGNNNEMITITATGFRVSHTVVSHNNYSEYFTANESSKVYHYLVVK